MKAVPIKHSQNSSKNMKNTFFVASWTCDTGVQSPSSCVLLYNGCGAEGRRVKNYVKQTISPAVNTDRWSLHNLMGWHCVYFTYNEYKAHKIQLFPPGEVEASSSGSLSLLRRPGHLPSLASRCWCRLIREVLRRWELKESVGLDQHLIEAKGKKVRVVFEGKSNGNADAGLSRKSWRREEKSK